jgi:hypothetical protein
MMIKKGIPLVVIVLSLLFLFIPLKLPLEGGYFFVVLGLVWLTFQLWNRSEFFVSKAFLVLCVWLLYLLAYQLYGEPIPVSAITVQRFIIFLMLTFFTFSSLHSDEDRRPWEDALIIIAIRNCRLVFKAFKCSKGITSNTRSPNSLPLERILFWTSKSSSRIY